jgi:hypothetical protein
MQGVLSASDYSRASIAKMTKDRETAIHVAFERRSMREPAHRWQSTRSIEIAEAVIEGAMAIIDADVHLRLTRWIGNSRDLYLVSDSRSGPTYAANGPGYQGPISAPIS